MEPLTAPASLADRWAEFKLAYPKSRVRDAAQALGVGEAALLATGCTGQPAAPAVALAPDFKEILLAVPALGHVMALTRNNSVVHERQGTYHNVSFQGPMGLVLGEEIDLRLFLMHWKHAFAANENGRRSLQFFGIDGCTKSTSPKPATTPPTTPWWPASAPPPRAPCWPCNPPPPKPPKPRTKPSTWLASGPRGAACRTRTPFLDCCASSA